MFAWLWNYFSGYVMISVEGLSLEKFLNLAAEGNVKLWNVRRLSYIKMSACVSRAGFHKLRACLRGLKNTRIHIETKHGAPFRLSFLRFRKALVFGSVLFSAALITAAMFVWEVRVVGNERVPESVVLHAVYFSGARRFVLRRDLDMLAIASAANAADERIAWAGAKLEGARLIIEVVESAKEPRLLEEGPADIVAIKDGVVGEITVLEGVARVTKDSAVRQGDVLISGTIEHEWAGARQVRARGEVLGRVWYEGSARIGAYRVVPKRTGKERVVTRISIAGWEVQTGSDNGYEEFETEPIINKPLGALFLPVRYIREKQYELKDAQEPLPKEHMMEAAREMALAKLYERVGPGSTILGVTTKYTEQEGALLCEVFAEAQEPIGVVREHGAQEAMQLDPYAEDIWTVP